LNIFLQSGLRVFYRQDLCRQLWCMILLKASLSLYMRLAVRSLLRPGNATRTITVTLTSALSVSLVIFLVEDNLRATFIESYPKDAPTLFCLDIQKDQRLEFSKLVGGEGELFSVIRARLTAVNDRPVNRKQEIKKKSDNLAREFNLTYREQLLADETLVGGTSLFVKNAQGEVSVTGFST